MSDHAPTPPARAAAQADAIADGLPLGAQPLPAPAGPDRPDTSALRELLVVALPTVATMSSYTAMTFVDKLMCSRLDADPIYVGAQGNGGLMSWVPVSIVSGTLNIINTYVSQNFGAGRPERGPAYAWNGVWLSVASWILLMLPAAAALPGLLALGREANLPPDQLAVVLRRDALAAGYAQILLVASILTMARMAIAQFFYGMHRPGTVLLAGVAANIANIEFNSILIYGPTPPETWSTGALGAWFNLTAQIAQSLGIPRLGLTGAAIGTVLAALVEFAVMFGVFIGPRFHRLYQTRSAWTPSLQHAKDIIRLGIPGGLMFGNEMICWGLFMVYFVGHFGADHSTAGWIAHQYMSLSFMPAVGISVAVTAVVGKRIGMGRHDLAASRAWLGTRLAMVYMGLCGVCFVVFREPLVRLFLDDATSPEQAQRLIELGGKFLILTAIFQLFDALAMVMSGALRGAGDTVVPGIVTVALSWLVIVGGGIATVELRPQWESLGPWGAAASYIILLSLFLTARFLSGRWKRIRLVPSDPPDPARAAA